MIRQARYEEKTNVQGGAGTVRFYHIVEADELYGHGRLYAKIVVPPGASIGWHVHHGETEPYFILSGEGLFTDSDGSVHRVTAGDSCLIEPEHGHSIANEGPEDLVFIALIHKA
ncbi:MAG: cupin domain-containing protein [Mogibacterium sp.]|nr:cupin domain-containing protein [Mogibacterium sp.]